MPLPIAQDLEKPVRAAAEGPNFFIIGAAKAATTSLCSLLEQHPEAAMVQSKEPHFFSFDRHYAQGWEAYLRLYGHCRGEKAVGDASTSYSRLRYHPQTLARMKRHVPGARILYMVRHPLDRMVSACLEHGRTPSAPRVGSLGEAIRRQPMILDSSRYWEVYEAYRRVYGESRIKVVWFEDYTANPLGVFREVCGFLGIDGTFHPDLDQEARNQRQASAIDLRWEPALRRQVIEALREDNLRFLAHFGRTRDHWNGLFSS